MNDIPVSIKLCLLLLCAQLLSGCGEKAEPGDSDSMSSVRVMHFEPPAGDNHRYPFLTTDLHGEIMMTWIEESAPGYFKLNFSRFHKENARWNEASVIAEGPDFFDNWADIPSVAASPDGFLVAHWLQKVEGGPFAYHIRISLSKDGESWSDPITLHEDKSPSEHGFVSLQPLPSGNMLAVWLDGRNTAAAFENIDGAHHEDENETAPAHSQHNHGAMTLRSAEIDRNGQIANRLEIDSRVCDCCPTELVLSGEYVYVVYRDRSEDEIRDFYMAEYDIINKSWSNPTPVHEDGWQIGGCPVNGARALALGQNLLISWFTMDSGNPVVRAAYGNPKGDGFKIVKELNTAPAIGRVAAAGKGDNALILWLEEGAEHGIDRFAFSKWRNRGRLSESEVMHEIQISGSRRTGFPQLIRLNNDANYLLAWTAFGENSRIEMRQISFN
ncbi:MAG: exo-alpha-sialidase [Balneolales bacterium]|nr:exo-alpha-sialidase [Balneolales bacterium]